MTDQAGDRTAGPRCPTCSRVIVEAGNPARPLYALRCTLIALGHWLDETFRVLGPPLALPDSAVPNTMRLDE